jgi:hypothetical protein
MIASRAERSNAPRRGVAILYPLWYRVQTEKKRPRFAWQRTEAPCAVGKRLANAPGRVISLTLNPTKRDHQ